MTATPEAAPATTATGPWPKFTAFKQAHHLFFEVLFFFAGFTFDVVLLHRIDSTPLLIHQGSYLVLSAFFIGVDHRIHVAGHEPRGFWAKPLSFRTWLIHFLLGTLLNAYVVFYFRATSVLSASSLFMAALLAVMVINELPKFREKGPVVRVALLSFATTSYFAYLLPVLVGHLSAPLFLTAVLLGTAATFGLWQLYLRLTKDPQWTLRRAVAPGLVVQAALVLAYFANVLPPVPLSLKSVGIYHQVEKVSGEQGSGYQVSYVAAPAWKFWSAKDAVFHWREGDKAWAFAQVFAPDGFKDRLSFQWQYDDPKRGWVDLGGPSTHDLGSGTRNREQGFRTFANATVSRPGTYRVVLRSSDGRELGRETFDAVADLSTEPRELKTELK
jgi:hypothetical protein